MTCIRVTWHILNHFTKLHGQTHAPVGMVTTVQYTRALFVYIILGKLRANIPKHESREFLGGIPLQSPPFGFGGISNRRLDKVAMLCLQIIFTIDLSNLFLSWNAEGGGTNLGGETFAWQPEIPSGRFPPALGCRKTNGK